MYVGIGVLLVTLILSGVTYAVLTWTSTKTNIGINTDCFTIDYTKGDNITGKLKLVDVNSSFITDDDGNEAFLIQEGMGMSYINLGIKSTCNIEGYGSIYLNVTELSNTFKEGGDSYGALGYAVLKNTSDLDDNNINITNLKDQEFELIDIQPITETGKIRIHVESLSNTETNKYLIVIFIDSYSAGNDALSGVFKGNISAEATQGKYTFAMKISDMYNSSTKTPVENNKITYQYDQMHNLMKDVGDNIRYYGANPNNYIYFNCDDYSNQSDSTCEKWRIIGVFDGKVKIMRNEIVEELAWDYDKNIDSSLTTSDSNWKTASLQVLLNTSYLNRTEDVTYYNYSTSDGTISTIVKTSTMGIKDSTRGLISESMWYLRRWSSSSVFSDQIYNYERTTGVIPDDMSPTWKGKIAIPYSSDYGYAADFNQCTESLYVYNFCKRNNWMSSILGTSLGGWLLTTYSEGGRVWYVIPDGSVYYSGGPDFGNGVAPVLYLNSDLGMESGNGIESFPYKLLVN